MSLDDRLTGRDIADLDEIWKEQGPAAFRAALRKMAEEHPARYLAVCATIIPDAVAITAEIVFAEATEERPDWLIEAMRAYHKAKIAN
jgi:hypothetical protein